MKKALTSLTLILTLGQALRAEAAEITLKCQMYRQKDKGAIPPFTITLDPSTSYGTQVNKGADGKAAQVVVSWEGSRATFGTKFDNDTSSITSSDTVDPKTGKIAGLSVYKIGSTVVNSARFGTCKRIK